MSFTVQSGGADDVKPVADLIAATLAQRPTGIYLVKDPALRPGIIANVVSLDVEYAVEHGWVNYIRYIRKGSTGCGGPCAVAVWLPHTEPLPRPPNYDDRLAEAAGPYASRFREVDQALADHLPDGRYHHLRYLAVCPSAEGRDPVRTLLANHHALLDAKSMPAYAVADNKLDCALYRDAGYHEGDGYPLDAWELAINEGPSPDDDVRFWPMLRPAWQERSAPSSDRDPVPQHCVDR
ncbi:hypothetical protein ACQP2T_61295 [Nonomuraea sp. CA-143628]|uniref:hypothetical protein n=1 Tax=Nonomuraea sp. CA-143628 TaxID=3239997 RepID=UPI003D93001E